MDFRSDEEKRMDHLEGELGVLRECIEIIAKTCKCTAAERYSGHLTDCHVPALRCVLDEAEAGADPVYRDPTA